MFDFDYFYLFDHYLSYLTYLTYLTYHQLKIISKYKTLRKTLKTLKKSHAILIEGIDALTDHDPVTGEPLFNAAETLHWLNLTGGG